MKHGLIPVFLFDILQQHIRIDEIYYNFKIFLKSIKCNYPTFLEEIGPDYNSLKYKEDESSGSSFKSILYEVINNNRCS